MNWVRTVSALQTSKQFMKKVKTVQTLLIYTSLNWENIELFIFLFKIYKLNLDGSEYKGSVCTICTFLYIVNTLIMDCFLSILMRFNTIGRSMYNGFIMMYCVRVVSPSLLTFYNFLSSFLINDNFIHILAFV